MKREIEVVTVTAGDRRTFEKNLQAKLNEKPPNDVTTWWVMAGFAVAAAGDDWTEYCALLTREVQE